MSLDEKITWCPSKTGVRIAKIIEVIDVKQFIKELKEKGFALSQETGQSGDKKFILISEDELNELAGKGLI